MFSNSVISPAMIQAYQETEYHVTATPPLCLRVGVPDSALAALHSLSGVNCSCFVTSCNPFSVSFDDTRNARRIVALSKCLRRRGLGFIEGAGRHPTNGWAPEPSYLVLGASLAMATSLGRVWSQNAVVWSGSDAVPQLILLR